MVLELHELGYQVYFKNFRCQRQVPRWTKKMGYSSSLNSSTPNGGRCLIISQTVLLGQIFLQLMLMGHFGRAVGVKFSNLFLWSFIKFCGLMICGCLGSYLVFLGGLICDVIWARFWYKGQDFEGRGAKILEVVRPNSIFLNPNFN